MGGGSGASQPVGSVDVALAHAVRLLEREPRLAAEQASEILKAVPGHANATLLLGIAHRLSGNAADSLGVLAPFAAAQSRSAAAQCELGLTLGALGRGEEAVAALRRALQLNAELPDAWRALADHLGAMGDEAGADAARARFLKASTRDPRLFAAAAALSENRIPEAELLLRRHLLEHPTDIAAIRMFAEVAVRVGRLRDAENLLSRCLELAPAFHGARHNYAVVLFRLAKLSEALPQVEKLLAIEPGNPNFHALNAAILAGIGEYERATRIYTAVLEQYPNQPKIWLSFGHALKTAGRTAEGIRAYRRTIELDPQCGEAYWSLANLKTFRFTPAEIARMQQELARPDLKGEERFQFHFALGKALEDDADYAAAFAHYQEGNALRRAQIHYDGAANRALTERTQRVFSRDFFAARAGGGANAPDPIFIVGLPRAGSTLIEQILASHSLIEGTMELPDLPIVAHNLPGVQRAEPSTPYPENLAALSARDFTALGEEYLRRTRIHRKRGTPFFIDKMPNNFAQVGLIHLILPNAKIIDARRHPLGCCVSAFKQHFARGQNFSYELAELGAYYRDYVELMAHFDSVLPGRVHRVLYERLIEDPEAEVRRLLEYCGLEFEPACLRFYENERAVRTASSEQVRTPLFRDGLEQWRHYERWLAPLQASLGGVLSAYPDIPDFTRERN